MNGKEQPLGFKNLFVPLTTQKIIVFIIITGFIVFFNNLFNNFVWDDKAYILQNPLVHSINIPAIFGRNGFNNNTQYRPLHALYFSVLYAVVAAAPFFYHILQLSLHIVNTLLVFFLLKHFLKRDLSLFLSFIFLVHPLQVESVSFIGSSVNPLFFLSGMIALLLSLPAKINNKRLAGICTFLLISILLKETAILFFFVILLYRIIFHKNFIKTFAFGSLITLGIYYLLRITEIGGQYSQSVLSLIAGLPLLQRLINIPAVIFYYLKNFLCPMNLAVDQMWTVKSIDFSHFYFPLVIDCIFFLIIIFLGIYILKKTKKMFSAYLFFSLWFLAGLTMHSQLIPLDMTVADRWFYFPIVGLLGIVGIGAKSFSSFTDRKIKIAGYILAIIIIMLFSLRTIARNKDWTDSITLFNHDSKITKSYDLENNLGTEYLNSKNYSEALAHYKKSVALFPNDINTYDLAATYTLTGNTTLAKQYYLKSFSMNHYIPQLRETIYVNLAITLAYYEKPTPANADFIKKGVQDYPNEVRLWSALAYSEYELHDYVNALAAAKKVKALVSSKQADYLYTQIITNQPIDVKLLR